MVTTQLQQKHAASSLRTCVVCQSSKPPTQMLRLSENANLVRPVGWHKAGRGASVCIRRECIEGLEPRHLARAFKKSLAPDAALGWRLGLGSLAKQRVLEAIGLARRQNAITLGVEEVCAELGRDPKPGVVIVAEDVAERTRRSVAEASCFATCRELGRACGAAWVGVVRIQPSSLADQAAYWLSVWYESRPIAA